MKTIKAKFIGKDSLGFIHGQVYELESYIFHNYLYVSQKGSDKKCPYSTLTAFLRNWEIIK